MNLIFLASAALIGIVVGCLWHVEPTRLFGACGVAALGAGLGWRLPRWRMLALVACASALGAVRASMVPAAQPGDALEPYLGSRLRLRAYVAEVPKLVGGGYARLVLGVEALGPPGRSPAPLQSVKAGPAALAPPRVLLLADPTAPIAGLNLGQRVTLEGRLAAAADARGPPVLWAAQVVDEQPERDEQPVPDQQPVPRHAEQAALDPGVTRPDVTLDPDVSRRDAANHTLASSAIPGEPNNATAAPGPTLPSPGPTVTSPGPVAPGPALSSPGPTVLSALVRALGSVRQAAAANVERYLPGPQASLAVGVLLGGSGHLSPDFKLDLQRSGLTHLLAIDGYKEVLVAALASALVVRVFGARVAILTTVVLISGYTLLTGAHPSAVRAALMIGLASVATLSGRVADPLTSLSLVVLALALVEPPILFDVGLQLSVSATLGIILLWPRLRRRLHRLPRWLAEPLGLSAAVTLATLPVTLSTFQFVSLVSPIAHVAAIPLLPLVLVSTLLLAVVAALPPPSALLAQLEALTNATAAHAALPLPLAALTSTTTTHADPLSPLATLASGIVAFFAPPWPLSAITGATMTHAPSLSPLAALTNATVAQAALLSPLAALIRETVTQAASLSPLAALANGLVAYSPSLSPLAVSASAAAAGVLNALGSLPPLAVLLNWLNHAPSHLPSLVLLAAWLAWLPTTLLAWVVHAFGSMPAAGISTGRLPPPAAVALAAALLAYGVWQLPELTNLRLAARRWQSHHPKLLAPTALAAACIAAAALLNLVRPDGQVHVQPLRLSRGQAVFIRGPSGTTMLVVGGQPSASALATEVAQNLAVWEHQLNLVVALDERAHAALAQTLARYPADQLINSPLSKTPLRLELGRGAAVDVWSARGQLRVAIDETTSVPTTSGARPGSAN